MNERICATAIYYVDSENVTPSHQPFRMQTSADDVQQEFRDVGQVMSLPACPQNNGSVETRESRLLAFPNVL